MVALPSVARSAAGPPQDTLPEQWLLAEVRILNQTRMTQRVEATPSVEIGILATRPLTL